MRMKLIFLKFYMKLKHILVIFNLEKLKNNHFHTNNLYRTGHIIWPLISHKECIENIIFYDII